MHNSAQYVFCKTPYVTRNPAVFVGARPPAHAGCGARQGFDDPDLLAAFPGGVSIAASEASAGGNPAAANGGSDKNKKEDDLGEEEARAAAARAEEECALLERAAHYALMMNADLQVEGWRWWWWWCVVG